MAERIRAIITGYDQTAQTEISEQVRVGQLDDYPVGGGKVTHGPYRAALILFLSAFVRARGLGRVFSDGSEVNLDGAGDIVAPDVWFASFERLPAGETLDATPVVAPDLVIEFLAPDAAFEAVHEKITHALDSGVGSAWLVAPVEKEIRVYSPSDRAGVRLGIDDDLRGDGVLAGFSLPLRAVFEADDAKQVEVLGRLLRS